MLSEERWGQWKGDDVSRFFFFTGLKFFQIEIFLWNVCARNDIFKHKPTNIWTRFKIDSLKWRYIDIYLQLLIFNIFPDFILDTAFKVIKSYNWTKGGCKSSCNKNNNFPLTRQRKILVHWWMTDRSYYPSKFDSCFKNNIFCCHILLKSFCCDFNTIASDLFQNYSSKIWILNCFRSTIY